MRTEVIGALWFFAMLLVFLRKISGDPEFEFTQASMLPAGLRFSLLVGFVAIMAMPIVFGAFWAATWWKLSIELRTAVEDCAVESNTGKERLRRQKQTGNGGGRRSEVAAGGIRSRYDFSKSFGQQPAVSHRLGCPLHHPVW